MLCLLSPAKMLAEKSGRALPSASVFQKAKVKKHVMPVSKSKRFAAGTKQLVEMCSGQSKANLGKMLKVSAAITQLNYDRFKAFWDQQEYVAGSLFDGAAYKYLKAADFDADDWIAAQNSLRILSGLYGCVKPLDLIFPYRLEMGTKIDFRGSKSLYQYWGDKVTKSIADEKPQFVLNVASGEYSKVVSFPELEEAGIRVVEIKFTDSSGRLASVYAKQARGMFVRYVIKNRCTALEDLYSFEGYAADYRYTFSKSASSESTLIFVKQAKRGNTNGSSSSNGKAKKKQKRR